MVLTSSKNKLLDMESWDSNMSVEPKSDEIEDSNILLKTLDEVEKDYIQYVLDHVKGNKAYAAKFLGLKRTTLLARMKKLGI